MKSLFQSFTTLHTLQNAWRAVRVKNSAGGVDGFTIAHFEKNSTDNLTKLHYGLTTGTWNPEPYLRVEIAKNETEKAKSYSITDVKYASGLMGIESQGTITY